MRESRKHYLGYLIVTWQVFVTTTMLKMIAKNRDKWVYQKRITMRSMLQCGKEKNGNDSQEKCLKYILKIKERRITKEERE